MEGLYDNGYYHRDIKPDNILIGKECTGILVDFGLCITTKEALEGEGIGEGTPEYAAPETGKRGPSLSAELYSVFLCFVEAFTGRCVFGGKVRPIILVYRAMLYTVNERGFFAQKTNFWLAGLLSTAHSNKPHYLCENPFLQICFCALRREFMFDHRYAVDTLYIWGG